MTKNIVADMAATVWQVHVSQGDTVASGDVVMVLESMKMEIDVESPDSGVVEDVLVAQGDAVTEGQSLVHLS